MVRLCGSWCKTIPKWLISRTIKPFAITALSGSFDFLAGFGFKVAALTFEAVRIMTQYLRVWTYYIYIYIYNIIMYVYKILVRMYIMHRAFEPVCSALISFHNFFLHSFLSSCHRRVFNFSLFDFFRLPPPPFDHGHKHCLVAATALRLLRLHYETD